MNVRQRKAVVSLPFESRVILQLQAPEQFVER